MQVSRPGFWTRQQQLASQRLHTNTPANGFDLPRRSLSPTARCPSCRTWTWSTTVSSSGYCGQRCCCVRRVPQLSPEPHHQGGGAACSTLHTAHPLAGGCAHAHAITCCPSRIRVRLCMHAWLVTLASMYGRNCGEVTRLLGMRDATHAFYGVPDRMHALVFSPPLLSPPPRKRPRPSRCICSWLAMPYCQVALPGVQFRRRCGRRQEPQP